MLQAATGEEGLSIYKQTQPDLIIVDLMMQEVDADTSFIKNLKAQGCTCLIYMLSSMGDSLSLSIDYSELGLTGVLQKPISPKPLLSLVKRNLK